MAKTQDKDPIAREGYLILAISFLCALVLARFHFMTALLAVAWIGFCVYFFRNPKRIAVLEPNVLVAPADGTVLSITSVTETLFLQKELTRVGIFMSPFNVHVNRIPEDGEVLNAKHCDGEFLAAYDERAGEKNERWGVHYKTKQGDEIVFVQVAGWFARRIVNYCRQGDQLKRGEIFGVIKFGSRVDVYLPKGYEVKVALQQKVKAGETIIAARC